MKFIAPYSLVKYEKIIEWDNGYLVVLTKYNHSNEYIEEYIDLIPVLKNLYIEPEVFLKPIKKWSYSMIDIKKIADEADVIISGYAFTRLADEIKVFNLNNGKSAAVFQPNGTLIETNMDDIELEIATKYMLSSLKYMGN